MRRAASSGARRLHQRFIAPGLHFVDGDEGAALHAIMVGRATALVGFALVSATSIAQAPRDAPAVTIGPIVPALDRPCRQPTGSEADEDIVVCGRRQEERRSPYRIPAPPDRFDPATDVDSVSRERNGMLDYGDSGIHSCSTVGPGGYTGCTFKQWKADREQFGRKKPQRRKPR